jgi:uncharacterized protein YgfB (UPF0149 family)
MKNTFDYVEHYIEFLGGYRDANGGLYGLFGQTKPPVNLARYDVNIINSLAAQTAETHLGYTDKQADLARRLVSKYRRQLSNLPTPVLAPELSEPLSFRLQIRQIDRRRLVYIEDSKFAVKFPFDSDLINSLKKQLKEGQGSGKWNNSDKTWNLAMTESTLNWLMAVEKPFKLELSDEVKKMAQQLLDSENQTYKIELTLKDQELEITNAASGLLEYIKDHFGGLGMENLTTLVDNSSVLGYTVNPAVLDKLNIDKEFTPWLLKRMFNIDGDLEEEHTLDKVIEYARLTNRLPVYLYQGQTKYNIKNDLNEIVYLDRDTDPDVKPRLLVTTTTFMIGHKRARWLQSAEKIVILNNASNTTD